MKEERRCESCGCFKEYVDNSYLSEGGWTEDEGYVCNNPKCPSRKIIKEGEFEEVCDSLLVKITNNEKAVARYIWTTQQKKIDELEREKALSDDSLQDYIKMANDRQLRICNLEREKEETVKKAFIFGYEKGHNDTVESGYGYIEDKADDYWQELKEERG